MTGHGSSRVQDVGDSTDDFLRMKFTKCRRSFGIDCRAMVCYLRGGKELDGFFWPDDNA
jgi:hypothetical protein